MANFFKKFLATTLLVASLTGCSSTQVQISNIPSNLVQDDEALSENGVETTIDNNTINKETAKENEKENADVNQETIYKQQLEEKIKSYYSTHDQVVAISQALGAKPSALFLKGERDRTTEGCITRLEHKQGKPLKVAIHPSMSENVASIALEQADYLFSLVQSVNSNFAYEVVEFDENADLDIVFQNKEIGSNGEAQLMFHNRYLEGLGNEFSYNYYVDSAFVSNVVISINERAAYEGDVYANREGFIRYYITHELLHAFGFYDVYLNGENAMDSTTLINNLLKERADEFLLSHITPNDYKNLISLYAPPSDNLAEDIKIYEQMVDEFSQKYYEGWAQDNFQNKKLPCSSIENGIYSFQKPVLDNSGYYRHNDYTFEISVEENKYNLVVKNQNGEVVETSAGKVRYLELNLGTPEAPAFMPKAVAILENVESANIFKNFSYGEDFDTGFSNIALFNDGYFTIEDVQDVFQGASYGQYKPVENIVEK